MEPCEDAEPEIYAVKYHRELHLFDDPGDRLLWIDERVKHGASENSFELWET